MPAQLALISTALFAFWLVRRDVASKQGVSNAVWIPILWGLILGSRPVSMWLSGTVQLGGDYSDGSPVDRTVYLLLIVSGVVVLLRRPINWSLLITGSKALLALYLYFLVSVLWAENPFSSFKRLFKDFGCVIMALIIITDRNPTIALRAVFSRCAYILIPLSVCFLRYFPDLGRAYSIHSGAMEVTGVTCQKNSLGGMIAVCGLVLLWDVLCGVKEQLRKKSFIVAQIVVLLFGAYLLRACDSKTSAICLFLSGGVLVCAGMPRTQRLAKNVAMLMPIGFGVGYVVDLLFSVKDTLLGFLGRDSTFTGRTEVWKFLLDANTDPLIGTGYYSLWSDPSFRAKMPEWMSNSAHSGYLEAYLEGGVLECLLLGVFLFSTWLAVNRQLRNGGQEGYIRFAFLITGLIANFSESYFARLSIVWFALLIAALFPRISDSVSIPKIETQFDLGENEVRSC